MENVIEHVAAALGRDPLAVRLANMTPDHAPDQGGDNVFVNSILPLLKQKSDYDARKAQVEQFNKVRDYSVDLKLLNLFEIT